MHGVDAPLDASRRLWHLAGLAAFVAMFLAVLAPFDVVFEFLDGGDIDAGIGEGMAVLTASAIAIWLLMALMVRTGLASPQTLPWPLPGFFPVADVASGAPSAAAVLKRCQRAGFRLLWSVIGLRRDLEVDGRRIGPARAALEISRHNLLETLTPAVTVRDGEGRYGFRCSAHAEFVRVYTMLEREEGTVEWLRREVRPDDVVYDIGANIGAFTFIAARQLRSGLVYAFEPHLPNATSLLANVRENGLQHLVRVVSCPLSDQSGVFDFDYRDMRPGTALSQLAGRAEADERPRAASPELKLATTIDELLEDGAIRPADLVKLNVDGQELEVLRGMRSLLTAYERPRAVQVEVNREEHSALLGLMRLCGYELASRHCSAGAKGLIDSGTDPDDVPFNGIFRPVGFERARRGAELRPYVLDTEERSLATEGPVSLGMGRTELVDAINEWLEQPANRSRFFAVIAEHSHGDQQVSFERVLAVDAPALEQLEEHPGKHYSVVTFEWRAKTGHDQGIGEGPGNDDLDDSVQVWITPIPVWITARIGENGAAMPVVTNIEPVLLGED
jgi:FkbM family methyltransferase